MAETLMRYYSLVEKEGGLAAKIKLAVETKLPSAMAAVAPDSPQNIDMFRRVYTQITGKRAPI